MDAPHRTLRRPSRSLAEEFIIVLHENRIKGINLSSTPRICVNVFRFIYKRLSRGPVRHFVRCHIIILATVGGIFVPKYLHNYVVLLIQESGHHC